MIVIHHYHYPPTSLHKDHLNLRLTKARPVFRLDARADRTVTLVLPNGGLICPLGFLQITSMFSPDECWQHISEHHSSSNRSIHLAGANISLSFWWSYGRNIGNRCFYWVSSNYEAFFWSCTEASVYASQLDRKERETSKIIQITLSCNQSTYWIFCSTINSEYNGLL